MTSPRSKPAGSESSADLAKVIAQAYRDGMAASEKAFADAAAASRGANDQANLTLVKQGEALIAAYGRIADLEKANANLLHLLDGLGATYAQKELIASKERIAKAEIEADANWKTEAVKQLGPGVRPAIDLILGKLGHSLLRGDGTPDGEGRAACLRAVMKIIGDPDLEARCRAAIGDKDWSLMIDYFQRQAGGPPAAASASN